MTPNILVVDDDPELRENIREILDDASFAVTVAANGEDALDCLKRQAFDVILLDLIMPGLSGKEVLPLIKRQSPSAKVIMITAFATIENAVSAMRKGADDYLTKPFKVDELLTAVRRCLEEARLQKCRSVIDVEDTFNCLANVMRREILLLLAREGKLRFMDIARKLEVEDHTKVNFHLKVLRDARFIEQDARKLYVLSKEGRKVVDCMQVVVNNLSS
ncbi:MAG TPA: response regulator [Desulfuromonadales bacterium]|nr:response regulator [Desulfuromonadales bacterium]